MKKIGISISIILLSAFFKCTESNSEMGYSAYTIEVEVQHIKATKRYEKLMYGAKLNRILFEITYTYKKREYTSNISVNWQFLSPNLIQIVENKAFEKLIVKCISGAPEKVMVFVKD